MTDTELQELFKLKDCCTCKHGGIAEQLEIPLCNDHSCDGIEHYEAETDIDKIHRTVEWFQKRMARNKG